MMIMFEREIRSYLSYDEDMVGKGERSVYLRLSIYQMESGGR